MKASQPPPGWPAAAKPLLRDADATRSAHFRILLRNGTAALTWITSLAAACVFGALEGDTGALVFGVAISPLVTLLVLAAIADRRAATDFFTAYAASRGLSHAAKGELPPMTPLLGAGDRRRSEHLMRGPLEAGGPEATIALYTYETRHALGDDDRDYEPHPFTVCLLDLPEAFPLFKGVYLQPRRGALAHDWQRGRGLRELELESVELGQAYRLRTAADQDPGVVRELFAPALQVRLFGDPMRPGLELGAGGLCVYVPGKLEDVHRLDAFVEGVRDLVASVRREIAEARPYGALTPSA